MKTTRLTLLWLTLVSATILHSCKKEETTPETPPVPVANFSYIGGGSPAPATIQFTNTSTHATSYNWDFGDNGTSTDASPSHTYTAGGVYTVKLTSTGAGGNNSTTKTVNIGAAPTKVFINKVTLLAIPFVDANGSGWDNSNGPDLFFNITDQANNILLNASSAKAMDITPAMIPYAWTFTTPYEVSTVNTSRFFDLWDYDSPDADDYIGYVEFAFNNYTSGASPYPLSVTETRNGITIKLDLTWQ